MKNSIFFLVVTILAMWGAVECSSLVDDALTPGVLGGICLLVSVVSSIICTYKTINNWSKIKAFFVGEFDEEEFKIIGEWWNSCDKTQRAKDCKMYYDKLPEELEYDEIAFIYYNNRGLK